MTDPTNTTVDFLTSLNRHLRTHGLGRTISTIHLSQYQDTQPHVQVFPFVDPDHLATLVRWLLTLTGTTVKVTAVGANLHLLATGNMDDGTVTGVTALLHGSDRELVEANCDTSVGAWIAVELLLRLVSAEQAEHREPALAGTAVSSS